MPILELMNASASSAVRNKDRLQHHVGDLPIGVMNETETWKPETRALHFAARARVRREGGNTR